MVNYTYRLCSLSAQTPKMKTKAQYKVKNWNAYDAALKQRGSITFWVNQETIEQSHKQQKTGKKGASNYYSNTAITIMGTLADSEFFIMPLNAKFIKHRQ
jgi:hypothetical protein